MGVDSSERWITSVGKHYFEGGRLVGALGVSWDSTEQDRNERALGDSEELFRTLSSSCPIGIFRTDLEGHTTYVNPRLSEIWGVPAAELLGNNWKSRLHPADTDAVPDIPIDSVAPGAQIQREYRLLLADGRVRWIQSTAAVVHDRDGKPTGKVGTVDDITERKNTLLEWQGAKESAEIASRSKDLFLANVSHELRTPLNGVLGMADLLLVSNLSRDQREMAEIVRDSGRSLLMVVNDILDLSRIEAGKLVIERAPFDWNAMIRQVKTLIEPDALKKGLHLEFRQPENIATVLVGDAGRIKQILLVFLTNALKFTAKGGVVVEVAAETLTATSSELLVAVHDTGPGLSLEQQEKLFRPFSQVDPSSTRKHGGIGLGLSIARSLAELMSGRVGVMSEPGEGATFWLRLVLPTRSDVPIQPSAPQHSETTVGNGRVLVAEDNPVNQTVALAGLKRLGWQADIANSGTAAFELAASNEYSLILMDCQMPDMDGYLATKKIREWEREQKREAVPIVALTAHAMRGDREKCLEAGMDDYLAKPFALSELQDMLVRWTRGSASQKPVGAKGMVA
jgi:PAS domain S-box-containing protein